MNTTITRTFAAAALPLVHAQIAKAVKLATRLGAPQPLVTISDVYQAETGRSNPITGVKITKAVFDNLEELGAVHPQAKAIALATATNTPIQLHPGAQRYFDEAAQ